LQIGKKEIADLANRIMKKILVIRLSSLGDVVLTAPILTAMRTVAGIEIHLLTKPKMGDLLHGGEAVDKFYTWGQEGLFLKLKSEKYDGILDLHCNFRSYWVRIFLGLTVSVGYQKKRLMRWLFVKTKSSRFQVNHVQERYLDAARNLLLKLGVEKLEVPDWSSGLPQHPLQGENANARIQNHGSSFARESNYGVAILGGTYQTKKIPKSVWKEVFSQDKRKWYLIGGPGEKELAVELLDAFGDQLIDGVNFFDLATSSRCIALSDVVVGGDTGFSHVAAAYNKPLLLIWGSTDPGLGFAAGYKNKNVLHLLPQNLTCHPCSKLGFDACPQGHFRCMMDYSAQEIKLLLQKLQANSLGGR
jgi:ADP-heptose:LPS heptosyltransferase